MHDLVLCTSSQSTYLKITTDNSFPNAAGNHAEQTNRKKKKYNLKLNLKNLFGCRHSKSLLSSHYLDSTVSQKLNFSTTWKTNSGFNQAKMWKTNIKSVHYYFYKNQNFQQDVFSVFRSGVQLVPSNITTHYQLQLSKH